VRNAIDHGIETPVERIRAGKDATARIRLAAYHRSGQIVLEVADDGRGLDRDRILKKAMERNLVKPGAQLTDNEVFLLIFEPGFSTAERITDLSGRGVGMDVVRRQVQRLRGRIEIQTEPGRGTTFLLQLPLTLAIIEGLVVRTGESLYILPLFAVTEIFRPEPSVLSTVQGRGEMALVRGHLLPVVRLHERFGLVPRVRALCEGMLVVVESQGRQFCLFVDELVGKQEVVIKSLGEMFREVAGLAGCAILGDGRVGLILDIEGIVQGRP
jgi:two-component system chemotaxis sensor kinase CheA